MAFDLINDGILAGLGAQTVKMLGKEVAHAQRPNPALVTQTDERPPCLGRPPIEGCRPMDHIHIDVIETQKGGLTVEGAKRGVVPARCL